MKTTVKQIGIGSGAGEPVEILSRKEIEKRIDELNPHDIFKMAYRNYIPNALTGEAQISLKTGELTGGGYSQGSMDQACDSVYVVLYTIGQNDEIVQFPDCGCDHDASECECQVDEDGNPYNLDDMFPEWRNLANSDDVQFQLDEWYAQEVADDFERHIGFSGYEPDESLDSDPAPDGLRVNPDEA